MPVPWFLILLRQISGRVKKIQTYSFWRLCFDENRLKKSTWICLRNLTQYQSSLDWGPQVMAYPAGTVGKYIKHH